MVSRALLMPLVKLLSAASPLSSAWAPTSWVASTTFSATVFTKLSLIDRSIAVAAASVTFGAMDDGFSST